MYRAQRRLRLGEVRARGDRVRDSVLGSLRHFDRSHIAVDWACRVDVCQASPRERELWIELRCLLVELDCASVRVRPQLIPEVAAMKVEIVRLGVLRVPRRQRRQPLRRGVSNRRAIAALSSRAVRASSGSRSYESTHTCT